jgi:hypothetical protein
MKCFNSDEHYNSSYIIHFKSPQKRKENAHEIYVGQLREKLERFRDACIERRNNVIYLFLQGQG